MRGALTSRQRGRCSDGDHDNEASKCDGRRAARPGCRNGSRELPPRPWRRVRVAPPPACPRAWRPRAAHARCSPADAVLYGPARGARLAGPCGAQAAGGVRVGGSLSGCPGRGARADVGGCAARAGRRPGCGRAGRHRAALRIARARVRLGRRPCARWSRARAACRPVLSG
jgi:hypothetical protein